MRTVKTLIAFLGASLVACIGFASGPPDTALFMRAGEPVKDRYLIKLRPARVSTAEVPAVAAELASRGGRLIATYSHGIRGFGIHTTEKQVLALARDPRVEMIEEAAVVHLSGTQTFPVGDYWHLDRLDGLPLSGSYSWISDGYGVDVYVVDTGIL